jgi:hypothetical protein
MTKQTDENGNVKLELEASDVESAIRHFICACHPELASGYVIEVAWPVGMAQGPMPLAIAHIS